jgi:type II secretory pathway component PulJ
VPRLLPIARRTREAGFSMLELLVATAVTVGVLGATALLANQVQARYRTELDVAAVRAEAQFALDWIVRDLRAAGSNPYRVSVSDCPASGTDFQAIRLDPNGNGVQDDIRIHADVNPSNGVLGGVAGACTEANEDLSIAHDPVNRVVTRRDHNAGNTAVPMSDSVITALRFTYLDAMQAPTTSDLAVSFIGVEVTAETRTPDPRTGQPVSVTVRDRLRVRLR